MTIKANPAPAHVVRAFLNDPEVWRTIYLEDEEFLVDGERQSDVYGVANTAMVTIVGGDVYQRGNQTYQGSLKALFNEYLAKGQEALAKSLETVTVKVDAARRDELMALLKLHRFEVVSAT